MNGERRLVVEVRAPDESLELVGSVLIQSTYRDSDTTNNRASVNTQVMPAADLLVRKNGPDTAYAGEEVEYTLTVTNLGPSPAETILLTDLLPSGMRFVSAALKPVDTLSHPVTSIGTESCMERV